MPPRCAVVGDSLGRPPPSQSGSAGSTALGIKSFRATCLEARWTGIRPRRLGLQCPHAVYYLMALGNGRRNIMRDDVDRIRLMNSPGSMDGRFICVSFFIPDRSKAFHFFIPDLGPVFGLNIHLHPARRPGGCTARTVP
jgi:hypothetical protein